MKAHAYQPDRSAERLEMVERQIAVRGVRAIDVLAAMRAVPRERFVPDERADEAYSDSALPIDCGQTISQPYIVARMTELLALPPGGRALEIGTGTGYQTAVLSRLAGEVYTIEWHLPLMVAACERLRALGAANVRFRCGDGSLGWAEQAPFDGILVTAGAPDVPDALTRQLAVGAKLVVPIGPVGDQSLLVVERGVSGLTRETVLPCRFVKLLGSQGWSA